MAAYTSTTVIGMPTTGFFKKDDTFVDAQGFTYLCALTGQPGVWVPDDNAPLLAALPTATAALSGEQRLLRGAIGQGASANTDLFSICITTRATSGYQAIDITVGAKIGSDTTSLANDATVYTLTVTVDGVAKALSITGSTAQTYTTLCAVMATQMGTASASMVGGDLRIVSASSGTTSTVAISLATTFLAALGGGSTALGAVAGLNEAYAWKTVTVS